MPGAFCERDGRRVVFDAFLPLAEVARLKYAPEGGGRRLAAGTVRLDVGLPEGADPRFALALRARSRDGQRRGEIRISSVEFPAARAHLEAHADAAGHSRLRSREWEAASAAAARFLGDELELSELAVREPAPQLEAAAAAAGWRRAAAGEPWRRPRA